MAGDVTEENQIGQRASALVWFWRLGSDAAMDEVEVNPRMKECQCVWTSILSIL